MSGKPARKRPSRSNKGKRPRSSFEKAAFDGLATAIFMLVSSTFVPLAPALADAAKVSENVAMMACVVGLLVLMTVLCSLLGGAVFNPANNAFLWATGKGRLSEHAFRSVGQMVGAVAGLSLVTYLDGVHALLPAGWTKMLPGSAVGLREGVDVAGGAACEFVLGMALSLAVLYASDSASVLFQLLLPLVATLLALSVGAAYTGPSLNPALAFAFQYWHSSHTPLEHGLVFWAAPIAAGLAAGWCYAGAKAFYAPKPRVKSD